MFHVFSHLRPGSNRPGSKQNYPCVKAFAQFFNLSAAQRTECDFVRSEKYRLDSNLHEF